MKYWILAAFVAVTFISQPFVCTKPAEAKRVLTEEGFSHIEIGDYSFLGCGKGNSFSNKFKAISPAGLKSEGIVCCNLYNNCSIRH